MLIKRLQVFVAMCAFLGMFSGSVAWGQKKKKAKPPQYQFEQIKIPAATADEPVRSKFSLKHALDYIDNGAIAWSKGRKCVTCHTNAIYMVSRPALTAKLGKPPADMRTFFVDQLNKKKATDRKKLRSGETPTQVAYIVGGLAEWDAHVTKKLSPETDEGLKLMFELQSKDGSFANTTCWPPFESSSYHGATVGAMAAATAPGWLESQKDKNLVTKIETLKNYLKTTKPPHDYGRLLLLWTSTRMPGLVGEKQKTDLVEMVFKHQRKDGGWSIRTFSTPEKWGSGGRAKKLRAEPEFENPPSDGHQTGLAVLVLRDSGVPASDPRIQRAVKWLLTNQRESGRWWTRSLNTNSYHFITFSGTCYPLLALSKCDALPALAKTAAK